MVVLVAQRSRWWKSCWVGWLRRVWLISIVVLPGIVLVLGLALALLVFAFSALGFLADRLGEDVGDGDWVLEDLFGGLFEGLVVAHLHGDCPRECVPSFLHVGKALGILSGQLDESLNVCVYGFLVGYLNENPGPSDCV